MYSSRNVSCVFDSHRHVFWGSLRKNNPYPLKRIKKKSTYSADEARLLLRSLVGMAAGCKSVARPSRSTHSDLDRSRTAAAALADDAVYDDGGAAATLSLRPPGNVDGGGGGWSLPSAPPPPLSRDTSFMDAADDDRSPPQTSPAVVLVAPPPTDDRRRHVREPVLNITTNDIATIRFCRYRL